MFYYFLTTFLAGHNGKINPTTSQNYPKTLPEPLPEKQEIAYTPVSCTECRQHGMGICDVGSVRREAVYTFGEVFDSFC